MKKQFTFLKMTLLMAVLLWGMGASLHAQTKFAVGPGTYTGYSGTYTTIALAYAAIPSTITGPYVIELQSDYVPAASEYPITFTTAKTGASDVNSITIRPATGAKLTIGPANKTVIATVTATTFAANASATVDVNLTGIISNGSFSDIVVDNYISGIGTYKDGTFKKVTAVNSGTSTITAAIGTFTATSVAGNKLFIGPAQTCAFKFNGCKYVIIDGVSRTGATGLTIQNPNTIYAQTVYFAGNSQYNCVKNCILRGANQTGAHNNGQHGTVYFMAGNN